MEHFITKENSIKTLKPENMRKNWNQFSLTNFLAISEIRRKQKKNKSTLDWENLWFPKSGEIETLFFSDQKLFPTKLQARFLPSKSQPIAFKM